MSEYWKKLDMVKEKAQMNVSEMSIFTNALTCYATCFVSWTFFTGEWRQVNKMFIKNVKQMQNQNTPFKIIAIIYTNRKSVALNLKEFKVHSKHFISIYWHEEGKRWFIYLLYNITSLYPEQISDFADVKMENITQCITLFNRMWLAISPSQFLRPSRNLFIIESKSVSAK